jgi:signal transduction histidine kinase
MKKEIIVDKFKRVFWLHVIAEFWFLLTYSLFHKNYDYHPFMLTVILSNFVILFLFKKDNNYNKYAGIMYAIGTIFLSVLVYSAGGMKAPAPFTFALIPITAAFFLDLKYLKASFLWCLGLFTITMVLGEVYPPAPLLMNYQNQKIINTIVFIFIFYGAIRSFVLTIEEKDKEINKQTDSIQNLLRILIHDVANPLMSAKLRINHISGDDKHGQIIKKSLNTITNIIEDVRKLEQIGHGKLELSKTEFDVEKLFEELEEELSDRIELKKLNLEFHHSKNTKINTDYSLLKNNVLMNILTNAIKFSEEGQGVLVKCDCHKKIEISITDYGEGIPPEILEVIFSPDKPTTRRGTTGERGSGFGMPIVKKVLELMEGEIKIETNFPSPGNEIGTVVTITL